MPLPEERIEPRGTGKGDRSWLLRLLTSLRHFVHSLELRGPRVSFGPSQTFLIFLVTKSKPHCQFGEVSPLSKELS
jgi:hypothetical protein